MIREGIGLGEGRDHLLSCHSSICLNGEGHLWLEEPTTTNAMGYKDKQIYSSYVASLYRCTFGIFVVVVVHYLFIRLY